MIATSKHRGVLGETWPEVRVQALFQDQFFGVMRQGHPLLARQVTPERYAACGHVIASRPGRMRGPVDEALAALGLARTVVAVVPGFPAAIAVARRSDLVALVGHSFMSTEQERQPEATGPGMRCFPIRLIAGYADWYCPCVEGSA